MPIKLLIIEENEIKQEALKLCLSQNTGIQYDIIADVKELDAELNTDGYTHLVSQALIKNESVLEFSHLINLPLLIINDGDIDLGETSFSSTKSPLSYSELFAFLVKNTPISYSGIEEYAMGDEEFFNQLKGLIVEEFSLNFKEIPTFIEIGNLAELKSRAHQMSSKFSMIDMPLSWQLCKEIDMHILEDTEKQIENMKCLLVDIEIALLHLN
ncbi:MAG: hypothetical protein JJE44_04580 [Flavobacteriaceae bacterium]|nr:hypothetical protein [Flavobacteriaceae bacterium]